MDGFRSKSVNDERIQLEIYDGRSPHPPSDIYDFKSYIMSYASSAQFDGDYGGYGSREVKFDKGKGASKFSKKGLVFSNPKVYTIEERVKSFFRRSFRWLKDRYTKVVYG